MRWDDLAGMETQRGQLVAAVQSNRMGHAHILTGPAGSGKKLFATMVARSFLCEREASDTLSSCGECPSCKQVEAGTHPDCQTWVKPEEDKEFKIDFMRQLIETSQLKAAGGRGKVFIIEPADAFNEESSNCFLKTLEEPPPGMWIALLCENSENLLPTIRSRCQTLRFTPLPAIQIERILEANGVTDQVSRKEIARLSEGIPGLAMTLSNPAQRKFWQECGSLVLSYPFSGTDWSDMIKGSIEEITGGPAQRAHVRSILKLHMGMWADLHRLVHGLEPRTQPESLVERMEKCAGRLDQRKIASVAEATMIADDRLKWGALVSLAIEAMGDSLEDQFRPAQT